MSSDSGFSSFLGSGFFSGSFPLAPAAGAAGAAVGAGAAALKASGFFSISLNLAACLNSMSVEATRASRFL